MKEEHEDYLDKPF